MSNETLKSALAADSDSHFDGIEAIAGDDLDDVVGGACMNFTCWIY